MRRLIDNFKKYKYLLYQLVKKDVKLKYRNSYLGVLWTLLEPLLTMLVLVLVFSGLLGKGKQDYAVYVLSGRLIFSFFQNATRSALKSVRGHASMIKKVYVPKYMYPLSNVISGYVIFLISLVVLAAVAIARGVYPTLFIFEIIVPLITVFILTLGVGIILSAFEVFFRDMEYLWGVALMLIMYLSAIFYDAADIYKDSELMKLVFELNPLYCIIENFRNAVFGMPLDLFTTLYSAGFSIILLAVGFIFFYKKQDRFILYL